MKSTGLLVGVLLFLAGSAMGQGGAERDDLHLLLRTEVGDLLFRLHGEEAPAHVRQIRRLADSGVYDGVPFFRIEAGFMAQVADVGHRVPPLGEEERKAIVRIPGEFGSRSPGRGDLVMAREPSDPDSAESSFMIMFGDAPHLRGKYTLFGSLVQGKQSLSALEARPVDSRRRPKARLEIRLARVLDGEAVAALGEFRSGRAPARDEGGGDLERFRAIHRAVVGILGLLVAASLGIVGLAGRGADGAVRSLGWTVALLALFLALSFGLVPSEEESPWGVLFFFAALATIRAFSEFEPTVGSGRVRVGPDLAGVAAPGGAGGEARRRRRPRGDVRGSRRRGSRRERRRG